MFKVEKIGAVGAPTHEKNPHPLPQHEFSMIIVAAKGSGKTNLVCNLIMKMYKGYFNKIWVCSPTTLNDEKWDVVKKTKGVLKQNHKLERAMAGPKIHKTLPKIVQNTNNNDVQESKAKFDGVIPKEDFFESLDELPERLKAQQETIEKLRDLGKGDKSKFIADRVLVIIDDTAGLFKAGNFNNPFVNYIFKHRHYGTSVIVVTQAYKAVVKSVRTGCNALILFEGGNPKEIQAVYEEWDQNLDQKEWMKVYRHCTEGDFNFMYINSKFPQGERIFKNFDKMIKLA